jgi:hypothetical protein
MILNKRCGFTNVEAFRAFCAIGDVDPDAGHYWTYSVQGQWIWLSRKKDIVFETFMNPLKRGSCLYFGLTGVADKAIAMYNFVHDNAEEYMEDGRTYWADLTWERIYA